MKRALICILCLLICFSSCVFAGCTANNDKKDETTTVPAATDTDPYSDDLPARMDYDKQVINVLCRDSYGVRDELAVNAEDMGNTVSALVYNRNLSVADRMNIVINPILIPDDPTNSWRTSSLKVQSSVLAGDNSYDIASMNFNTFIMAQGYFKDLNNIDSIDLDKYYWSHNFNDCFQIAGAQYCATGMAALSFYRYMYVMAYNEELLEQQKIDSLFDLVKSGEWTMEKLYTMTVDVYENRNSNDSKDASDFYGFVSGARTSIDAYWVSLNMTVLSKNSDGLYDLNIPLERVSNGTDAVIKQFWLNTGSYIVPTGDDNFDNEKICDIFVDSRAMIAQMRVYALENIVSKQAGFEYSIIPMPKYDINQTNYYTHESDQMTAFGIVNNDNLNDEKLYMLGAFLECMASQSYDSLYLQYFENILSYRVLQNPESVEMINLIYESVNFMSTFQANALEVGVGTVNALRSAVSSGFNNMASFFKSNQTAMETAIDELNDYYLNG